MYMVPFHMTHPHLSPNSLQFSLHIHVELDSEDGYCDSVLVAQQLKFGYAEGLGFEVCVSWSVFDIDNWSLGSQNAVQFRNRTNLLKPGREGPRAVRYGVHWKCRHPLQDCWHVPHPWYHWMVNFHWHNCHFMSVWTYCAPVKWNLFSVTTLPPVCRILPVSNALSPKKCSHFVTMDCVPFKLSLVFAWY